MTSEAPSESADRVETPDAGGPADADRLARLRAQRERLGRRYSGSSAEHLWRRLDTMDFINRGMLFAGILLICFLPFMIIVNALLGRSTVAGLVRHLGLDHQAAKILSELFTSSTATSSSISGLSGAFFVLSGIAGASAIQDLYERAFDKEHRGMRDIPRQLVWLAFLLGAVALGNWGQPHLREAAGPVVLAVTALILFTGFWWVTMWFLLGGRVPWRELFPSAVATAVCWLGMQIVFTITFSNTVVSNDKKYGAIGVVFALMSWLIAIGVVIILGAVIGLVWRERELSWAGAWRWLRRRRGVPSGEG